MDTGLLLSDAELLALTGYKRAAEQRRQLDESGIPWKDMRGRTIVLKSHVEAWVLGKPMPRSAGPRMELVR